MDLHGIHHVTAVTGDAPANVAFYTQLLGLRLVKKSVNQDDVSAYHLFYADKLGSPGTDMTFFDWPQTPPHQHGTDSIARTWFRVNGRAALEYWIERFGRANVRHGGVETFANRTLVRFEDPEGQRLTLADDQGASFEGEIWDGADVPAEYAIRGFYGVTLSVPRMAPVGEILVRLLGMEALASHPALENDRDRLTTFTMDGGGPGREVCVLEQPDERPARLGHGGVHHVAFRLRDDEEQRIWVDRLNRAGVRHSGIIDRYYFKSVYFRISVGILFELATDGPGFTADEPLASLGERLALPPFLEPRREEIEAGLKPLPTSNAR
ncbi:MAG: ring-cleaving dioxygenase [Anaerolineae bacterium]|nr:ring-cleaving dioxygenase [Anaerolineae bacterium]